VPLEAVAVVEDAISGKNLCCQALQAASSLFWIDLALATAASFRFLDSSALTAAARATEISRSAFALVESLRWASFSWAQTAALGGSLASVLLLERDDQLLAIFHSASLRGGLDDFNVRAAAAAPFPFCLH
jgi:hypothetical protein